MGCVWRLKSLDLPVCCALSPVLSKSLGFGLFSVSSKKCFGITNWKLEVVDLVILVCQYDFRYRLVMATRSLLRN